MTVSITANASETKEVWLYCGLELLQSILAHKFLVLEGRSPHGHVYYPVNRSLINLVIGGKYSATLAASVDSGTGLKGKPSFLGMATDVDEATLEGYKLNNATAQATADAIKKEKRLAEQGKDISQMKLSDIRTKMRASNRDRGTLLALINRYLLG